ncbi:hypothetical protein BH09DEP1_BH09DEP1_3850 [soil metagenome]
MKKVLFLSLLLPLSFSLHAISPLSIAKLGGAAVAGALSMWSGKAAINIYSEGKSRNDAILGAYYAAPYGFAAITSGILAGLALKSALDIDLDFNLRSIKIK